MNLIEFFPADHSSQIDAYYYIRTYSPSSSRTDFVDLGAGGGSSHAIAKDAIPGLNWIGIDIEDSPEVRARRIHDLDFRSFDGINIPLSDASVDFVFSRQVFEHVRHPEPLLREIRRILRPGGVFAGSVSQLEPFHSFSISNFTFYGFATMALNAGLHPKEFRPGVDGLTLIARHFFKFHMKQNAAIFDTWIAAESPLNSFIASQMREKSHQEINQAKTQYAGHLCFKFIKP
ncbi:methyltransferase [Bordetella ansorpii]|uniref:Methyltransferase n=1 Tax=Bordetella ansorpii TaxID=288768 RepID=A0A157Q0A2_9BORD|nr:class I SAM-dependent methyltransferase [Bordetella ansorpii]SAI39010.1 methyltransferase [Bordetella ansorpii]